MTSLTDSYIELITAIRTRDERNQLVHLIEDLEGRLFRVSGSDLVSVIRGSLPQHTGRILEEIIKNVPSDGEVLKNFFLALERELSSMRVLRIETAIHPSEELIADIHVWLVRESGGGILLDFTVDKSMLGGARLSLDGRYKEFTLAHLIEKTLEKNHENILKQFQ